LHAPLVYEVGGEWLAVTLVVCPDWGGISHEEKG